jgi:SAM-dependent methyltransferase
MAGFEEQVLLPKRRRLLGDLRGQILEVGSGTGVNFQFYRPETEVLAVEPSTAMLAFAQRKQRNARANIRLLPAGIGDPVVLESIPAGGFDAIVCTLVLCTAPAPQRVIGQLYQWLKPEGRLVVLEHIRTPDGWQKKFHRLINPLWRYFGEGCELTRPTDRFLQQAGFSAEYENYFRTGLYFYEARLCK